MSSSGAGLAAGAAQGQAEEAAQGQAEGPAQGEAAEAAPMSRAVSGWALPLFWF